MSDRLTYVVQPAQGSNAEGWEVRIEDADRATRTNLGMDEADDLAEEYAWDKWIDRGIPSRVKIRDEDGQYVDSWPVGETDGRFD